LAVGSRQLATRKGEEKKIRREEEKTEGREQEKAFYLNSL
jgi:hypothetical protein